MASSPYLLVGVNISFPKSEWRSPSGFGMISFMVKIALTWKENAYGQIYWITAGIISSKLKEIDYVQDQSFNPLARDGKMAANGTSTHPPIDERVRILHSMGGVGFAAGPCG